jgi:hypothetical protein
MSSKPVATFPVAVMMSRKLVSRSGWSLPCWEAVGVVSGEELAGQPRSRELVHEADGVQDFLFRGFELQLFRDAVETYWFNLTADRPSLFVLCLKDADEELVPNMVTPDSEAAQAAVETAGAAFAVPIPPDIHTEIEQVVMKYYRPEPPRKRKQHDWRKEDN